MIRPSEVQALRCLMLKKLWKKSSKHEPILVLLGEVLTYVPPHVLTLNCPMEEIVLDIEERPDFIFVYSDDVYGTFATPDKIILKRIYPIGKSQNLATTTESRAVFHYDSDTCRLFVMYDDGAYQDRGASLLQYELKTGVVRETYRITGINFFSEEDPPRFTTSYDNLFIVMKWSSRMEVFHMNFGDPKSDLVSIWSSEAGDVVPGRFTVVSHEPLVVRLHYDHETKGCIMASFTKCQYSPCFTSQTRRVTAQVNDWIYFPVTGSTSCRYGDYNYFVLWDCKTSSTPPEIDDFQANVQRDRTLFACPAAFDGIGTIYYIISRQIQGVSDTCKSIRLVRAFIYLPSE